MPRAPAFLPFLSRSRDAWPPRSKWDLPDSSCRQQPSALGTRAIDRRRFLVPYSWILPTAGYHVLSTPSFSSVPLCLSPVLDVVAQVCSELLMMGLCLSCLPCHRPPGIAACIRHFSVSVALLRGHTRRFPARRGKCSRSSGSVRISSANLCSAIFLPYTETKKVLHTRLRPSPRCDDPLHGHCHR